MTIFLRGSDRAEVQNWRGFDAGVSTGQRTRQECQLCRNIAKHTKVDMIWVAGRSPTLVSHSLRGVATNLKATTLAYLAIV